MAFAEGYILKEGYDFHAVEDKTHIGHSSQNPTAVGVVKD